MRKLLALGLGLALAASLTVSAFAAPTRAIVQELGAVAPAGEVSINLNAVNLNLTRAVTGTTVGGGTATIGGTAIDNITVGLGNGFEVRTGNLPGLLAESNLVATPMGVTVKYAGFYPGLAVYGAYGSNTAAQINTGVGATTDTSATRFGAAYTTTISGFVVNGNVQFGSTSTGNAAGNGHNVTEFGLAALYPLNANLLIGGEYLNSGDTNNAAPASTTNVSGFALGGRVLLGHFTVDAVLLSNFTATQTGVATNGTSTQIGNPALVRINYTF